MKIEVLDVAFVPFAITIESDAELNALYESISNEYNKAQSGSDYEKVLESFLALIRER